MEYARAVWDEFLSEHTEGTIPSRWIELIDGQSVVRYPLTKTEESIAIAKRSYPQKHWSKFPLIKIKLRDTDRSLCENFEFNTEVEAECESSDEERNSKRKKKKKQDLSESEEEEEDEVDVRNKSKKKKANSDKDYTQKKPVTDMPVAPTIRKSPRTKAMVNYSGISKNPNEQVKTTKAPHPPLNSPRRSPRNHSSVSPISNSGSLCSPVYRPLPLLSPLTENPSPAKEKTKSKKIASRTSLFASSTSSADIPSTSSTCTHTYNEPFPLTETNFQKKVLRNFVELKELVKALGKTCEPVESGFHVTQLQNVEDFKELEEILVSNDERKLLIARLSNIGGVDLKDNARKVLRKLLHNDIMAKYNLYGRNNKMSFTATNTFKVVTAAIMKSTKAKESDIVKEIGEVLKHAPDRRKGK